MVCCVQAASSDLLCTGQESGETGGVLLHPGGLRGPGEDGAGPPREPQASTSMYLFISVLTLSKVNSLLNVTNTERLGRIFDLKKKSWH